MLTGLGTTSLVLTMNVGSISLSDALSPDSLSVSQMYPVSMRFPETLASLFLFSNRRFSTLLLVCVAGAPSSGSERGPPFSSTSLFLLFGLPNPARSGGSRASKLIKLAIANPSIISSSHDTDSRFLRRGGRCRAPGKTGRHSPPLAPRRESPLQSSWSEAEEGDEGPRSALLLRRSLSR